MSRPKKTGILNIQSVFMKYMSLFFFLHRRSQRRASMPGCHLFYLLIRLLMSAYAPHAHA
jgi:hypothetical protein